MSLYTKYRPRDWDSVIGQDMISTILRNSLRQGRVGHAYIFTGSRGTGKTTSARILAKWVNCENLQDGNPCHTCANCQAFDAGSMLDIIEIDAASNRGIDNVRELIDKSRYEPSMGKWKIYIIDEVHMLTGESFNALLKTLEEPPPHVKFILATTEIEKVPETIRSRSLRFDFRKITEADIVKRLQFVAQEEWIKIEDEALTIIAKAARGWLRDALTLLEQNTINGEVSTEYVRSTLALLEDSLIKEIIDTIHQQDIHGTQEILQILRERHVQVRGLFDQILYALRDRMFANITSADFFAYESIFRVFENAYTKIKSIPDGILLIEITLLRAVKRREYDSIKLDSALTKNGKMGVRGEGTAWTVMKTENPKSAASMEWVWLSPDGFGTFDTKSTEKNDTFLKNDTEKQILHSSKWQKKPEIKKTETKKPGQDVSTKVEIIDAHPPFAYPTLLRHLKEIRPAIVTDLKMARFEVHGHTLLLIFTKEWNYKRVQDDTVRTIIVTSLQSNFSGDWNVECRLEPGSWGDVSDGVF